MEEPLNQSFRLPPELKFGNKQRALLCDALLENLKSNQYPLDYLYLLIPRLDYQTVLRDHVNNIDRMLPLTTALEKNTTIKTLILSDNSLSSTPALCNLFRSNKTITTLYLDNNSFGSYCAGILTMSLEANKTLTALYLGGNKIGDPGATSFSEYLSVNSHLKTLDLSSNSISDSGIKSLASGLLKNHGLTKLSLNSNHFGEEGARALAEYLKENGSLESLDLENCCNTGSMALKTLLEGLGAKKNRTVLKELKLSRNTMGEAEAWALSKALQVNYSINSLEIARNTLEDEEWIEGITAIVESVIRHPSIIHIDLRGNNFGKRTSEIVRMIEGNTRIILLEIEEWTSPEMSKALPKIKGLLKKNKETLIKTVKSVREYFSRPVELQGDIDRETLKYYQACDHDPLIALIGKEEYEKINKGMERYLATNYLKLIGCVGNGKSTIERLSSQTHLLIFSYLDLRKCLWLEEIYGKDKAEKTQGKWCNMW